MRKRRRSRGTWMPIFGTEVNSPGGDVKATGLQGPVTIGFNAIEDSELIITSLVPDAPNESWDQTTGRDNLVNVIGSEWILKRIVGKLVVSRADDPTQTNQGSCKVAAGFFVARAADNDPSVPIGLDASNAGVEPLSNTNAWNDYSPIASETTREPWIWRRTWLLDSPRASTNDVIPVAIEPNFPASNVRYGSVMDGGHVDAKTRRRVRHNQRLFFVSSAACLFENDNAPTPNGITVGFDFRVHGAMRKHRNQGNFQ